MTRLLADLFAEEPWQWGLRGDPHAWRAMREAFRREAVPLAGNEDRLRELLAAAFEAVVGRPLSEPGHVFVAAFDTGGMSSGMVSTAWWRETGMPLLLERAGVA